MQYEARCNGTVIARSSDPVLLEGNVYFPPESIVAGALTLTQARSLCPWKGVARYFTVTGGGASLRHAGWTYRHPSPLARRIKNHVAFWNGIEVVEVPDQTEARA